MCLEYINMNNEKSTQRGICKYNLNCDLFNFEGKLNDVEKLDVYFENCEIGTLNANSHKNMSICIINSRIKKIKCHPTSEVKLVNSGVGEIDYCYLSMKESDIKIARIMTFDFDMKNSAIHKLIVSNTYWNGLVNMHLQIFEKKRIKNDIEKITLIKTDGECFYEDNYGPGRKIKITNYAHMLIAEKVIINAYRKYKMRRKIQILHELKKYLIKDLAAIVLQYCYV